MNFRTLWVLLAATLISALVAVASWYHQREALDALHAQILAGELQPIAMLLVENQALLRETPAFAIEADKFRNYAAAWRDRWNSVMELFMAGGNYPTSEVPLPARFSEEVQAEIASAK